MKTNLSLLFRFIIYTNKIDFFDIRATTGLSTQQNHCNKMSDENVYLARLLLSSSVKFFLSADSCIKIHYRIRFGLAYIYMTNLNKQFEIFVNCLLPCLHQCLLLEAFEGRNTTVLKLYTNYTLNS